MGKTASLIIFVSIVLLIYGLIHYYIWIRTSQALSGYLPLRIGFLILLSMLMLAYPVSRFVASSHAGSAIEMVHLIGSIWFGAILYLLLVIGILDLSRWIYGWISPEFNWLSPGLHFTRLSIFLAVLVVVSATLWLGSRNARRPVVRHLSIELPKPHSIEGFRIVAASDLHMGRIIGKKRVDHLVEMIQSSQPDLVLFIGDLVDDEMGPVITSDLGRSLTKLQAKLGGYAVTGNHEYIGDHEGAIEYIEDKGIRFLRDEAVKLPNGIWLLGREDRDRVRFTGMPRKPLKSVLALANTSEPVILLDHQPYELEEKAGAGVFLSLSGHTHDGQLWPLNFLTKAIFGLSHGYKKLGNMHAYVSSGFGSWGPPIRIGNKPEIVIIDLK